MARAGVLAVLPPGAPGLATAVVQGVRVVAADCAVRLGAVVGRRG